MVKIYKRGISNGIICFLLFKIVMVQEIKSTNYYNKQRTPLAILVLIVLDFTVHLQRHKENHFHLDKRELWIMSKIWFSIKQV